MTLTTGVDCGAKRPLVRPDFQENAYPSDWQLEIEQFAFDLEVVGWGRSPILVPVTETRASATKAESAAAIARTAAVHLLTAIRSYTERTHS